MILAHRRKIGRRNKRDIDEFSGPSYWMSKENSDNYYANR